MLFQVDCLYSDSIIRVDMKGLRNEIGDHEADCQRRCELRRACRASRSVWPLLESGSPRGVF